MRTPAVVGDLAVAWIGPVKEAMQGIYAGGCMIKRKRLR